MRITDKETEENTDKTFEELSDRSAEAVERILRLKELSAKLRSSNQHSWELIPAGSFNYVTRIPSRNENNQLAEQVEYLSRLVSVLQEKVNVLDEVIVANNNLIENQGKAIYDIGTKFKKLNEDAFSYISDKENNVSTQYLNVELYLDTDDPQSIFSVYSSVLDFLETIDFKSFIELDAIKGSWWKKFIARSNKFISSDDVTTRLKEAEYALEVQILKSQSEVDKNQSEALSNIMVSLKDIPNAAIRIGSLLVVKTTNEAGEVSVIVQTLSLSQLHLLNKHPHLLTQPKNILDQLSLGDENSLN